MQKLVWQNANGVILDLTSGNYGITEWEGFSNASLNVQTQTVPFQDGAVFLDALVEQRELSVTLAMQDNNNLELRYQQRREIISALNPKLGEGYLIYTNDFITKQIKCVPQIPIFETHNSDTAGTPKASLSWTACNPYWEDLEETVVNASLKTISVINNEGDVPAQVEIEMYGNAVNPKITNLSSNKHIEYKGQLDMPLYINTGLGVKEVSTEAISFEYDQFKGYIWGVYYVDKINSYIALSEDCLLYSVDGNNWETHILGFGVFCVRMLYVPFLNKYIISCNNGKILVSDDLYNWEEVNVGSTANYLNGICCTQNLIIITGNTIDYKPIILTSTDGTTWTRQTSGVPITTSNINSIVYSESKGLFVAVGSQGIILTSLDGETWTSQTSGTSSSLSEVIYVVSLELFITTGANGVILTSPDGETWTSRTSGVTVELSAILENNSVIKIAGQGVILTSTDGTTWTTENVAEIEYVPMGFCHSDVAGKYVITGRYGMIVSSEDGQEWERQGYGDYLVIRGIAFGKGLYVAVCEGGKIVTSPNKKEWTARTSGVTSNINDIVFSKEKDLFVAVCQDGKVLKSNDGINWQIASTINNTILSKVKWVKEKNYFVIINNNDTSDAIFTTEDLNTFIPYDAPYKVSDVAYSPKINKFAVCFNVPSITNNMAITEDFNSFDMKTNPYVEIRPQYRIYAQMNSIVYSAEQDLFVAVGIEYFSQGTSPVIVISPVPVLVSSDGNRWTKAETPIAEAINGVKIIYSPTYEKFVITGQAGLIGMSSDGLNWESFNSGVATILYDIIDQDFDLVFVGDSSIVLSSVVESVENEIQNISEDSDLSFNLGIGENRIRLTKGSGNFTAKIKYRQKYIGV